MRNGIRVALAFLPLCGWIGWTGCPGQPGLTSGDAGFVHWIGLDSRPLAVGSQLIVTLEIATDGGAAPAYTVASSDPRVVDVQDAGNQRLLLDVRGEGSATLELQTPGERADFSLTAAIPAALELWDAEHLAAGIGDGGLSPVFDILTSSEEVLQGVVLDASGRPLNSWGLVQGTRTSCLQFSQREPEQLILASLANSSSCEFQASLIDAGLPLEDGGTPTEDGGEDGGGLSSSASSTKTYQVIFVASASAVRLMRGGPSELNVLAQALTGEDIEVFGIEDWEFSCFPPDSCTMNRLSPSVVSLTIQPGTGSHDVFASSFSASSSSQALTGMLVIP